MKDKPQNTGGSSSGSTQLELGRNQEISLQLSWSYEGRRTTLQLDNIPGIDGLTDNTSFLGEYLSRLWGASYNAKLGTITVSRILEQEQIEEGFKSFFDQFKKCPSCSCPGDLEIQQFVGNKKEELNVVLACPKCKTVSKIQGKSIASQAVIKLMLSNSQLLANKTLAREPKLSHSRKFSPLILFSIFLFALAVAAFSVWTLKPELVFGTTTEGDSPIPGSSSKITRKRINVIDVVPALEKTVQNIDGTLETFSDQHQSDLLWGTYRPNLYFGMRTRTGPDSILLGMMWYEPGSNPYHVQLHHVSKSQDGITLKWIHHNGIDYARQVIQDSKSGMEFTVTMMKRRGDNGGDWVVRVKGDFTKTDKKAPKISLMFYVGIENQNVGRLSLNSSSPGIQKPLPGTVKLSGYTPATSDFTILFPDSKKGKKESTFYSGVKLKEVWRIEQHLRLVVPKGTRPAQLDNLVADGSNAFVIQRFKKAPFEMDIILLSNPQKYPTPTALLAEAASLSGDELEPLFEERAAAFEKKFDEVFSLGARQFSQDYKEFAMTVFSDLMGGIGYFYGPNRIYVPDVPPHEPQFRMSQDSALFSATPSRRFFPRGFLWDEGFHQLLIANWDKELSKDMISHWLKLVDKETGWLPREQILGAEAESAVPPEFIVQYPDNGNPPTLYLAIEKILEKGELTPQDITWLTGAFRQLLTNFIWFMKTQHGMSRNSWYWRGAKGNHTLPSGFDDYPRADIRSPQEEHLDLLCWMTLSANILDKMAKRIDVYDVSEFKAIEDELITHLEERHWNNELNIYLDYDALSGNHVTHIGYVSLFPFLFGLIPVDSPRLGHVLDAMEDANLLKTNFGLRSLSASDPMFGTGENYWRGPIWINMNYLVLRALHRYYSFGDGIYASRAKNLYNTLRRNLITNLHRVYVDQHDVYEQYNPTTGRGQGHHPFTGWTSVIVLIMAEIY